MAAISTAEKQQRCVETVAKACVLLKAFVSQTESLRLCDLVNRTGLNASTALRILHTLERQGLVERSGPRRYRSRCSLGAVGRHRIGFAALSSKSTFSQAVAASIRAVAVRLGVDVLELDNRYSPIVTLRNIDIFIRERVELVVEYQTNDSITPTIASKFHAANIPFIALGTPHPGATFYGADSYKAGLCGGRFLGAWVKRHFHRPVDEIVLLRHPRVGWLPQSRLLGILDGIYATLPRARKTRVAYLDGNGRFEHSWAVMRQYLQSEPPVGRLVGAFNDTSMLGALRAFEEAGQLQNCVAVGQDASPAARLELRRPGTRLVATVTRFPERWGEEILQLALNILAGKPMPPVVIAKHGLITPATVNRYYPDDGILNREEVERQLLKS